MATTINLRSGHTQPVQFPQENSQLRENSSPREPQQPLREMNFQRPEKKRSFGWLIILIIIILLGVGGYFGWKKYQNISNKVSFIDQTKYQAVFLSNGQSYFGKVSNENENYVNLSDVYYLVQKQPLQSQQDAGSEQVAAKAPEYSLVKLGKEMHGPISMAVSRSQILFIENLSDDSKLVQAVKSGSVK
jgi:hypothetical protein